MRVSPRDPREHLDGLSINGYDPTSDRRALIRAANKRRQQAEATVYSFPSTPPDALAWPVTPASGAR